jgi:hypothetical protein
MDDDQDGGEPEGGFVIWDRREAWRAYQRHRTLAIQLGDIWAELAWLHVHRTRPRRRHLMYRKAAGLLVKAAAQFQYAGLGRRARSAWRYALVLHRAAGRAGQ